VLRTIAASSPISLQCEIGLKQTADNHFAVMKPETTFRRVRRMIERLFIPAVNEEGNYAPGRTASL